MSIPETEDNPFKWKQFSHDIILWSVRQYCQFALTYRDLVMMMEERGLSASHTTIMRWVHQYATEIKKCLKKFLKASNDSYRIDEIVHHGITSIGPQIQNGIRLTGC